MPTYSKLMSTSSEVNPRNLCGAVLSVIEGRVALRNVTQLCKVPTRAVRDVLAVVSQKQKSLKEHQKAELVESSTRAQITWVTGKYLKCDDLSCMYTHWELEESTKAQLFGSTSYYEVFQQYGVPKRTLRRWMKKRPEQLGIVTLKEV